MAPLRFTNALLINPPTGLYRRDDRCQCKVEDQTVQIIFPPIELASIAAALRRAGAKATIRDYPALARTQAADWAAYRRDLETVRPDMVLVNVTTATSQGDFQALALAKEVLGAERVVTIAKGEYMEALGARVLYDQPAIDFGFHGEIEQVLVRFLEGEALGAIAGLVWRRDAEGAGAADAAAVADQPPVVRNPGHPLVEALDELPWPARDLLDNQLYRSPESGRPLTVVHGNRGCPAKCIFCPAGSMSGYRIRYRSPRNIMDEIAECVNRFGIREFLFHGDTFTINKKWLLELCDLIIESGLAIRWGCNSRVDTMDDERAERMRRAGCWVVAFGVETGSQMIMDAMQKGQKVERAEQAVATCKRHGLRTHAFFVIGTPWETRDTLQETYRFAQRLDTDFFDFNIAYPLPGTELFNIVLREGLFEAPQDESGYASAAVRSRALSSKDLTDWRRKALLSMYLRPRYIARMLWRAGSLVVALNYARAGARRFRQLVRA